MSKIPLISVSGNHYEVGFQIGSALKKQINRTVKIPIKIARKDQHFKINYFIKFAQKYFPYANKYFPNYVTEIKGMADGSGQDFDLLWLLNLEEVLMDKYFDRCTSIVFRDKDKKIYLYHNEDWERDFLNNISIVKANINKKVKFLSLNFAGMLSGSSVALNSFGLVQAINSLEPTDVRIGIPKNFISRAILECRNIKEALNVIKIKERASAYNHILIQNDKVVNVETTARKYHASRINKDVFVHTNHYILSKFSDAFPLVNSKQRLKAVTEIVNKAKFVDKNLLVSVLSRHNKRSQICKHTNDIFSDVTLSSIIIDAKNLRMHATKGNPCKNKYNLYSLN